MRSDILCRKLRVADYEEARALYMALTKGRDMPDHDLGRAAYERLLAHPDTAIFAALDKTVPCAMATLHILPNVTNDARPYGLVENVVTLPSHEGRGFGRAVMQAVARAAWVAGAYKIMLLTGRANDAKGFYEAVGFRADEKHGMILRRSTD